MVRFLVSFFLLLTFYSCCYKGVRNEFGYARKTIKAPKITDKDIFYEIDTLSVYELKYVLTNMNVKLIHNPKENKGRHFLRFYGSGKVSNFTIGYDNTTFKYDSTHTIVEVDFDPKKSRMGYFYRKNGDKIEIKQFGAEYCKAFTVKGEIEVKNDTLIINEKYGAEKKIYIKSNIGREYLEKWKADW